MSSKTLSISVRAAVIATIICALILCGYLIPLWGTDIAAANPEFISWRMPWILFLWLAALPCFLILCYVWKVAGAIKSEEVFTLTTARWIKTSAFLLFFDAGFFLIGNLVFLAVKMSHPGILMLSILIDIFAIALAVLAAVLSRYITKAASLQEESEGTI